MSNSGQIFGEETTKDNGEVSGEYTIFNELKITNTFCYKRDIHKYSWSAREMCIRDRAIAVGVLSPFFNEK